jgi:hypothetical protein
MCNNQLVCSLPYGVLLLQVFHVRLVVTVFRRRRRRSSSSSCSCRTMAEISAQYSDCRPHPLELGLAAAAEAAAASSSSSSSCRTMAEISAQYSDCRPHPLELGLILLNWGNYRYW